jgi:NAD-dependent dihydropyrimidine dehydrogenase PreA subunit
LQIDKEKCAGCGLCREYCPVHAISVVNKKATVNFEKCTECNACYRSKACKKNALVPSQLEWPRTIRSLLSDVFTEYNGVAGRGTEEMKTNDVTGRFKSGYTGIAIEFGRPNVGSYFRDIQYVARIVSKSGAEFEPKNPVTHYLDPKTGEVNPDILNEFVISAIIEISVPNEKLESMLKAIFEASKHIETVFSLDVACRVENDDTIPAQQILDRMKVFYRPNCKTNVGLGKPAFAF